MGALYLKPLDDRMAELGCFYVRFMDDWCVLARIGKYLRLWCMWVRSGVYDPCAGIFPRAYSAICFRFLSLSLFTHFFTSIPLCTSHLLNYYIFFSSSAKACRPSLLGSSHWVSRTPPPGVVKNSWYTGEPRGGRAKQTGADIYLVVSSFAQECRSPLQLSATNDYQLLLTTPPSSGKHTVSLLFCLPLATRP